MAVQQVGGDGAGQRLPAGPRRHPDRIVPASCAPTRCPPRQGIRPATFVAVRVGLVILPSDRWREARRQWEWADARRLRHGLDLRPRALGRDARRSLARRRTRPGRRRRRHGAPAARHPGGDAQLPPSRDPGPRRHRARRSERWALGPRPRARERGTRRQRARAGALDPRRAHGSLRGVPRGAAPDPQRRTATTRTTVHTGALRRGRGAEHAGHACRTHCRSPSPPVGPRACGWPRSTASNGSRSVRDAGHGSPRTSWRRPAPSSVSSRTGAAGSGRPTPSKVILWTPTETVLDSADQFEELAAPYADLGFDEFVLHHPDQTGPYRGNYPGLRGDRRPPRRLRTALAAAEVSRDPSRRPGHERLESPAEPTAGATRSTTTRSHPTQRAAAARAVGNVVQRPRPRRA